MVGKTGSILTSVDALAWLPADRSWEHEATLPVATMIDSTHPKPQPESGPSLPPLIVRHWHGRVPASRGREYLELMRTVAIPDYRGIDGNLGAFCWHRTVGDVLDVVMVSWWRDYDCIRAFAGEDIAVAKYYPFDAGFLIEMEPYVTHFESFGRLA